MREVVRARVLWELRAKTNLAMAIFSLLGRDVQAGGGHSLTLVRSRADVWAGVEYNVGSDLRRYGAGLGPRAL